MLGRTEMTAPGVVNDHVEIACLRKRVLKSACDRPWIGQIEQNRAQSGHRFEVNEVAGRSPNFVAPGDERLRDGASDSRTGSCEKNLFHSKSDFPCGSKVKVQPSRLHELFSRGWMSILQCRLTFLACHLSKFPLPIFIDNASAHLRSLVW